MYPHQNERLTVALDRAGVEALVATSAANVAYVAGFVGIGEPEATSSGLAVVAMKSAAMPALSAPR